MNFYKRFIGDYRKKTARLSPLEHGVYGLLLDELYATEQPLPLDEGELFNIVGARSDADEAAVRKILERYFVRGADGWTNERATEEISRSDRKDFQSLVRPKRKRIKNRARLAYALAVLQQGLCGICKRPLDADLSLVHLDHVVPLSRGGDDDWSNLQVAHAVCNLRKGAG